MLTATQARQLRWIEAFVALRGRAPSYAEIGAGLGLRSKNSVWQALERLRERGFVSWVYATPGTLRVLKRPPCPPGTVVARVAVRQGGETRLVGCADG